MSKQASWLSSWRLLGWRTAVVVAFVLYVLIGFVVVPWIAEHVVLANVSEKLGVSMLKDKNGRIALDIPMEGDLRDPEFVVASAVSAAIAGVAGDLVKSPFRMLGRMVGGSDDQDLEFVDFDAGSAVLASHVTANLTTLAKALVDQQGVDSSRVGVMPDVVAVETGDSKVRCQLSLRTD